MPGGRLLTCILVAAIGLLAAPAIASAVPNTTIDGGPSGSVSSTSATFTFSSTESPSTFACALDGAGFGACPAGYTGLAQGSHTFQVRATSASGTDPTPASRTWTVDTVAPNTTIDTGPSGSVSSTSAAFTFSSNEASVTFQCALDGASFASCPAGYTGLSQGSHTFQVRATDAAGNTDGTPASQSWTVDTVAPNTTIDTGPSGSVSSTSAAFTFSSNEASVTFQCALDGASFASCPAGYTGLAQGSHTFQVRARGCRRQHRRQPRLADLDRRHGRAQHLDRHRAERIGVEHVGGIHLLFQRGFCRPSNARSTAPRSRPARPAYTGLSPGLAHVPGPGYGMPPTTPTPAPPRRPGSSTRSIPIRRSTRAQSGRRATPPPPSPSAQTRPRPASSARSTRDRSRPAARR